MSFRGEVRRLTGELPKAIAMPVEVSKKDTVFAVKPSVLLKLWEKWRQQGHASFDRASEAGIRDLWRSVAQGSAWNEMQIAACLKQVRTKLEKDSTLKARVLEDGSIEARFDRWLHYILLERSTAKVWEKIEELWRMLQGKGAESREAFSAADPEVLHKLHLELAAKDIDRNRRWRIADLLRMYYEVLSVVNQPSSNLSLPGANPFVTQMLAGFGLCGDEALTYPEFLAFFIGRVETDVVLCMYDLSNGAAKVVKYAEGIWHTSVEVFGFEYLYGGKCVFVEPGESCFGKPTKKLCVGSTLSRRSELHNFCCEHLTSTFTVDNYHLVRNNCNHFSEKILRFLCGAKVPHEVMHQADGFLKIPGMQSLWPVVTNWVNSRFLPGQTSSSEVISKEDTADARTDLGLSKEQDVSPHSRLDETCSNTTVATETGGEISTSADGTDSGTDLATTPVTMQQSSPSADPAIAMSSDLHWLMVSMDEDINSLVDHKAVSTRIGCFFNPFSGRK